VHPIPPLSLHCPESIIPAHPAAITIDGELAGAIYPATGPAGGQGETQTAESHKAEDFAFLDWTTQALPYAMLTCPAVLVLGADGGGEIGLAKYHQARRVVAVEMNGQLAGLMKGRLRGRGGDIYLRPGVQVLVQEARGYLAGAGERFDLIQVPAAGGFGAAAAGVQAGRESYLYTVEAFEQMLDRLGPGGMICVTVPARTPPRDGLRVLVIAERALRRRGRQPAEHLVMIRSQFTVTVVLFDSLVSEVQLDAIEGFCQQRRFDLCFTPGMTRDKANRFHVLDMPYYYYAAEVILGPEHYQFLSNYAFDVRATTDDRPYFYHFFRLRAWGTIREKLGGLSPAFVELGYFLLVATLLQSVPVALLLILLPLAGRARLLWAATGKARALGYFLLIGLGFMSLEMNFLQRLTVYLADPIYSAAVVIGAFLMFAGLGSQLSHRWRRPAESVIRRAGIVVVAIAVVYLLLLRSLLAATQPWPLAVKAGLAVVVIAPLAVAMGHMFPTALRRLGLSQPALVPWCWGINGFASVVATVGATLLAMEVGFTLVAAAGAGAYLLAFAVFVGSPEPGAESKTGRGQQPAAARGAGAGRQVRPGEVGHVPGKRRSKWVEPEDGPI